MALDAPIKPLLLFSVSHTGILFTYSYRLPLFKKFTLKLLSLKIDCNLGVIPPAITTPHWVPLIKITLETIVPKILKNNLIVSCALGSPFNALLPIVGAFNPSEGLLFI